MTEQFRYLFPRLVMNFHLELNEAFHVVLPETLLLETIITFSHFIPSFDVIFLTTLYHNSDSEYRRLCVYGLRSKSYEICNDRETSFHAFH
jgi:hypothetical protein